MKRALSAAALGLVFFDPMASLALVMPFAAPRSSMVRAAASLAFPHGGSMSARQAASATVRKAGSGEYGGDVKFVEADIVSTDDTAAAGAAANPAEAKKTGGLGGLFSGEKPEPEPPMPDDKDLKTLALQFQGPRCVV